MSLTTDKIANGEIYYAADFLQNDEAWIFFERFKQEIQWRQESLRMYGREIPFPRLTSWYGDPGKCYKYSGVLREPLPWTETLLQLKERIENAITWDCNSVLLNYYRHGSDSMSWHADNEKELGMNPIIVSINLGATRKFQIKHNITGEKKEYFLEHGSLFLMAGEMQHFWKHQLPKTKNMVGERINLTFRKIRL